MKLTWTLVAILAILIPVAAAVSYFRGKAARGRQAHWRQVAERGKSFTAVNGQPISGVAQSATTGVTAPIAVNVAGPVAQVVKLELPWSDADGAEGVLRQLDGCLPIAERCDLLWEAAGLYVATSDDGLRRIWSGEGADSAFEYVCFDGRYVWAALGRPGRAPRLFIAEPQSEQAWEYTLADGSIPGVAHFPDPAMPEHRLAVAPVSPGKVCAVVKQWQPPAFGAVSQPVSPPIVLNSNSPNFWLGTFEFAPPEARKSEPIAVPAKLELFDGPMEMVSLSAGEELRVVVGRGQSYPQLLINAAAGKVEAAANRERSSLLPMEPDRFATHEGALWRIRAIHDFLAIPSPENFFGAPALARAALPFLKEEIVLREAPVGLLVSSGGALYILGEHCWRLRGSGPELEKLAVEPPWQFDDYLKSNSFVSVSTNSTTGHSSSGTFQVSKPPPLPGRSSYVVRSAFPSALFGVLVSATDPAASGDAAEVIYRLKIDAPAK